MSLRRLRVLFSSYISTLLNVATVTDCAATLVMFNEKVLRYYVMERHDPEYHDTLNILVTLYE
jgi:hypothetical protein